MPKRGMNTFFKKMLDAKKKKLPSFVYTGKDGKSEEIDFSFLSFFSFSPTISNSDVDIFDLLVIVLSVYFGNSFRVGNAMIYLQ